LSIARLHPANDRKNDADDPESEPVALVRVLTDGRVLMSLTVRQMTALKWPALAVSWATYVERRKSRENRARVPTKTIR
jgi:hypothetical protein